MVSVIVATYNPVWDKLKATLLSVLSQKSIEYEILIADDGSENDLANEIKDLFSTYNFENYKILSSETNRGTVLNYYNAVLNARYDYIKPLSPGDCLFSETTLAEWAEYAISRKAKICFGDAIYYEEKSFQIINRRNPKHTELYADDNKSNNKIPYLLLPDHVLGAALITEKETTISYLKLIINKVKYCEDYILKFYLIDGCKITYFKNAVLWYEYGLGVSTNSKWLSILLNERKVCAGLLYDHENSSWRWRLIWKHQKKTGKLPKYRYFLFPSLLRFKLFKRKKPGRNNNEINTDRLRSYFGQ